MYRIIKKYDRYGEKDEIQARFHLEKLGQTFFRALPKWKPLTQVVCDWGDYRTEEIVYRNEADAKEHLHNLLTEIPDDEVIIVASSGTV